MFTRFAVAASLAAASLLPLAARAESIEPCELLSNSVVSVRAHKAEQHYGKITIDRVDGASVFVQARPGLTAEWLQRSLSAHLTKMKDMSMVDCPLEAKDLRIEVRSGGTGYWVSIIAKDHRQAELVLERAQSLLHHAG